MKYLLKYGFVGVLVSALLLAYVQTFTQVIKEPKLKRSLDLSRKQKLVWNNWSNGTFQKETARYARDHFGFFNSTLMNYNQLEYALFKEVHAKGVVIGENGYLYERDYIDAYYGRDFIGDSLIDIRAKRISEIRQKLLDSFNVQLMVLFAPGKASFYPEFIPQHLRGKYEKEGTNMFGLKKSLEGHQIPVLDLNTWFVEQKERSEYPLVPQTGIHWSYYGSLLAIDTILGFSEELLQQDLADMVIDNIELSRKARSTDDDIEKGLNLMSRLSNQELAYPKYHYEVADSSFQRVIVVGDSYGLALFNQGMLSDGFCSGQFWFYLRTLYGEGLDRKNLDYADKLRELKSSNLVILMCTESTARKFPFRFDEEVYSKLFLNHSENVEKAQRIKEIIKELKQNEGAIERYTTWADEHETTLKAVIFDQAVRTYNQEQRRLQREKQ